MSSKVVAMDKHRLPLQQPALRCGVEDRLLETRGVQLGKQSRTLLCRLSSTSRFAGPVLQTGMRYHCTLGCVMVGYSGASATSKAVAAAEVASGVEMDDCHYE